MNTKEQKYRVHVSTTVFGTVVVRAISDQNVAAKVRDGQFESEEWENPGEEGDIVPLRVAELEEVDEDDGEEAV
jgi:hypothetical protein